MENFCEYCCLNVIVCINCSSLFNITVSTTLKYYHNQALNKKLKLTGGAMKFFWKILLGREIFGSMVPWVTKYILNSLWNPPTPPSHILNVSSLTSGRDDGRVMQFLKKLTADWMNYLGQIKLCLQWLKQRTWEPYDWSIPFIYRSIMPAFTGPNKLFQRENP